MSKLPSGRFPFINLKKALARAKQLYESDRGGKGLRMPLAFAAWDYSEKSSGGFQTIGALMSYGLTEDEGSKEDRLVRLTQTARRYFQTEIESDQKALLDQFARTPRLFAHLLDHWDDSTPPDNVARTYLKTEIKLNEQSARSALSIFKDNLEFVLPKGGDRISQDEPNPEKNGEGEGVKDPKPDEASKVPTTPPLAVKVGDRVQWTSQDVDQFDVPKVVTEIIRDPNRGWFVSVRGEKGSFPMEQITVERGSTPAGAVQAEPQPSAVKQPIEVFLSARGRLQITADIDAEGVDTLIEVLEKYKPILALLTPRS